MQCENRGVAGFTSEVLESIRGQKYLWIRAGESHRYVPIWSVVIRGRLFIRSWYLRPGGWFDAFLEEKRGSIRYAKDGPEIPVRAKRVNSEAMWSAVDRAYAEKYTTPANLKYVKGFRLAKRRKKTLELVFDPR